MAVGGELGEPRRPSETGGKGVERLAAGSLAVRPYTEIYFAAFGDGRHAVLLAHPQPAPSADLLRDPRPATTVGVEGRCRPHPGGTSASGGRGSRLARSPPVNLIVTAPAIAIPRVGLG